MTVNSNSVVDSIKNNKKNILWTGLGISILGLIVVVFPFISTLSITYFAAIVFVSTGLFGVFNSFSVAGTGQFFGSLMIGLLKIACGVIFFVNPLIGMLYLTSLIALLFILEGAFEMTFAFEMKPHAGWGWILFSSIISIGAGLIVILSLGSSSLWLIGFIFGINILSTGFSLILISRNIN